MAAFQLSPQADPNKVFLVNLSEIEGRLDTNYYVPEIVDLERKIRERSNGKLRQYIKKMASGATPLVQEEEKYYSNKDNGVPFIRVQNLSPTNELLLEDIKYINLETHQNYLKRSQISENDLLVKITGVGRMAVSSVAPVEFEGNTNQHLVVIKTESREVSETLATFLNTDIGERLATRRATGGTRPALDYSALRSIPIVFIPKAVEITQKAVASKKTAEAEARRLLSSIDDYILAELGITLPTADNSLENRVFYANFSEVSGGRFDPKWSKKDEKIIFLHKYPIKLLKEICFIGKGQSLSKENTTEGEYPIIAGGQTSPYTHNQFNYAGNVITVSASGAYAGYVWYHTDPIFATDCNTIWSKDEKNVSTNFIYFVLSALQKEIYKLQQGAAQPHVYGKDLRKIKIPLPDPDKQKEIAETAQAMRQKAQELMQQGKTILEQTKREVEEMILAPSSV